MSVIVHLDDGRIAELLRQGRIIPCVRHVCVVCGQAVHDGPDGTKTLRCPHGCRLTPIPQVECRLCGAPVPASLWRRMYCDDHGPGKRNSSRLPPDGAYTMRFVDEHFHAAEGTGPVTQYAESEKVEVLS